MVLYACVYFPADKTFSVIPKQKFKTDISIGLSVDFVWKNEKKSETWKAIIIQIGENKKELDVLSNQLSNEVIKCNANGGDPLKEVIIPQVGEVKEMPKTPVANKRKRKVTTVMQESMDQQEQENSTTPKAKKDKKLDKALPDSEKKKACPAKNADIAASIILNNSIVKNFAEKLSSHTDKEKQESTSSDQANERVDTAIIHQTWHQALEKNFEREKTAREKRQIETTRESSLHEVCRQALETVNSYASISDNDEHVAELENMQQVMQRLQEQKNQLERENEELRRENGLLKNMQSQVDFQNLCPAPSSSVISFFKTCIKWAEEKENTFSAIPVTQQSVQSEFYERPASQPSRPSLDYFEGPSRLFKTPEKLETQPSSPRSPTPPPIFRMEKQIKSACAKESGKNDPKVSLGNSSGNFVPRRSPRKHVSQGLVKNDMITGDAPLSRSDTNREETSTEELTSSIRANLNPKEGSNQASLIEGIPVFVDRKPLRHVLSKCQNLKDEATAHLLRKLILLVFTTSELAGSRGQGLGISVDKDSQKPPLDAVKCKACKDYVQAYGMMSKKKLLDDTSVNSIFTQQVTYARNKLKRKNTDLNQNQ